METKVSFLVRKLAAELKDGKFGEAGDYFITVRQLASACNISLETACKVMDELCHMRLIRLLQKRYYISTGRAASYTPYGKYLAETRRPFLGVVLRKFANPFFSALTEELFREASKAGYTLIVSGSNHHVTEETKIIDEFISMGVSGIFTCPNSTPGLAELYASCPIPVVTLGRDLGIQNCDAVLVDNYAASSHAAAHLREIGCSRFLYVGMKKNLDTDPRLSGYRDKLKSYGYDLTEDQILTVDYLHENKVEVDMINGELHNNLRRLQNGEKLGIFCYHDMLAAAVLQTIKSYNRTSIGNYRIPQDIAIVGFDDLPIASILVPALTTISYRLNSIATQSMEIMQDAVNNPAHQPRKIQILSSLCIRESTVNTRRTAD